MIGKRFVHYPMNINLGNTMPENSKQSIADSLETEEKLLPHMPYLLQDMWALGSSVDQILDLITTFDLPTDQATLLDLGCGKGAVSVQAAARFGFKVTGIDAMPEFLEFARQKSAEYRVSNLCTFIEKDIHAYVKNSKEFDYLVDKNR